jgi:predicted dehydrogenase
MNVNQTKTYNAPEVVSGLVLFPNDVLFSGTWCFNAAAACEQDRCEIVGSRGSMSFAVFGEPEIILTIDGITESLRFEALPHVQQPMIESVVNYFLGRGANPCSAAEGVEVMSVMERMVGDI